MKLLFLPSLPNTNDVSACEQLKEMVRDKVAIVVYVDYMRLSTIDYNKFNVVFGNESFEKYKIIEIAPNCIIVELGDSIGNCKDTTFTHFAAPKNYCIDFVPLVLEYYNKQGVEVENAFIVIDDENIHYRCYNYLGRDMPIILDGSEMNESLEIYASTNDIPYIHLHSNWSNCLSKVEKSFAITRNKSLTLDRKLLYNPFFEGISLTKSFSILFTDRDGTILTENSEESYKNFELMKLFLEAGNLIFVLPSGNHTKEIFHEGNNSSVLWEMLLPYRNQIIGFPILRAGVTLGGIKIPVGGYTLYKNGFVEPIVQMFLDNGYDIRQIFCIGDTVQDFPMILETVYQFNGIGYLIQRKDNWLEEAKSAPNPFNEDDWKYVENHEISSFSNFMDQIVLPNMNTKKQMIKLNNKI